MPCRLTISTVIVASVTAFAGVRGATVQAQGPASLSVQELQRVHAVATSLGASAPPCVPVAGGVEPPAQNLAAEMIHEHAAGMLGMLVLKYPRSKLETETERGSRISQQEDLLTLAVNAHRRAHACHPMGEEARHIRAALALVAAFERQLREQPVLPDSEARYAVMATRAVELMAEIPSHQCPQARRCPTEASTAKAPETGYRARGLGRSFLRAELGIGGGTIQDVRTEPIRHEIRERILGPALRISAGLRQLAGKKDRHVFLVGGFYSFQHITRASGADGSSELLDSNSPYRMVHAGGLTVEWGIRLGEGAVSIHPGAEFGVQAFLDASTFGQLRIGGSLGLCFGQELVCLTGRVQRHLQATAGRSYFGPQLMVGLDLLRIVDRRIKRAQP